MFMAIPDDPLNGMTGFEWDESNARKIWARHRVTPTEAEEVFLSTPRLFGEDPAHSDTEPRYVIFGRTSAGRLRSVFFTLRRDSIRVVSARPMSRKERALYAEAATEAP